jgi:hypothetical protein
VPIEEPVVPGERRTQILYGRHSPAIPVHRLPVLFVSLRDNVRRWDHKARLNSEVSHTLVESFSNEGGVIETVT